MTLSYQELQYYEKNFPLLKEAFPEISQIIEPKPSHNIEIIKTKTNSLTISYQHTLLHSKYDPQKEGLNFALANQIQEGDIILLYGFGLGYHILPILETITDKGSLYVIELNKEILSMAFAIRDLSPLFQYKNFEIISGQDEIEVAYQLEQLTKKTLKQYPPHRKKVLFHTPCFKCIPKTFTKIKNALELLLLEKETTFVFKDQMKENLKNNLDYILQNPGIKTLFGTLKNKPAFFIGAGPSLDQALPYIKKHQEKAFIFCVDTAFPILTAHNIKIDFIVTVDPQAESFAHFKNHLIDNGILIFTPTACSEIIKKYPGNRLVVIKKDQAILRPVENDLLHKGVTIGGGSVSCLGLDILTSLKANPQIITGMDFAFPNMKAYSSHSANAKGWINYINKFSTLEMLHRKAIMKHKIVYLKNKENIDVPTHQTLYSYTKNIEQIVRLNPQIKYLNFMSSGVNIKGVENIYFTEEIDKILKQNLNKQINFTKNIPLDVNLKEKIISTILM